MLKIENLHATVAGKPILNGLSLTVPTGEIHAIMGPNGAGKSTLAYVLGGRPGYEVTEGSVTFSTETARPELSPTDVPRTSARPELVEGRPSTSSGRAVSGVNVTLPPITSYPGRPPST